MAQLVRGEQEQSVSATPSSSSPPPEKTNLLDSPASKETHPEVSDGNNSNAGHPMKPAWNKPFNFVSGAGPVMGDSVSWPALSEASRPPVKSTVDISNPSSDESVSASQEPLIPNSTENQKKHPNTKSNPNLATNPKSPARQRSYKRNGGTRPGPAQNGFIRGLPPPPAVPFPPPPPPFFPLFDMPYSPMAVEVPEHFPYNGWEGMPMGGFVPQWNPMNYQSSPRNLSRRGNFGGHYHNNNGRNHDQHHDLNASHSSNARDVRAPKQIAQPRGFLRPPPPPPPGSIPFIRPHAAGPFGYPMGFDMTYPFLYVPTPPLESCNEVPFTAQTSPPLPPLSFPALDDNICASLVKQIEYYFCDDNLCRDDFLRSKMDDEGWVPISLIAGFPKVRKWTNDVELIFKSLRASSVLELQPYKIRRRDEWKKWVCTPSRFTAVSSSHSYVGSTEEKITSSLLKVTLDEATKAVL